MKLLVGEDVKRIKPTETRGLQSAVLIESASAYK